MAKKYDINTVEELLETLRASATQNEAVEDNDWEKYIKECYDTNNRTADRMTSFKTASRIGLSENFLKAFSQIERLKASAQITNDPVKASVMLAAATCATEHYKEVFESSACIQFESALNDVKKEHSINPDVLTKYRELTRQAAHSVAGDRSMTDINDVEANNTRLANKSFDELDLTERTGVVSSFSNSFSSAKALKDEMGSIPTITSVAQQEYFSKVNDLAKEYLQAIFFPNTVKEMPRGITREEMSPIYTKCSLMSFASKQRLIKNELPKYKDLQYLATQDLSFNGDSLTLSLENGFFDNVKSNEFLDRSRNGTLTYTDIEWARGAIDDMFKLAYSDEIIKNLESKNMDPIDGLYIDGVSVLDMKPSPESNQTWGEILYTRNLTLEEDSRIKASVVAAALDGKKVDVRMYKYDPQTKQAKLSDDIVPVKTESKIMSSERFSFRRWLKQLFGLIPKSAEKRIEEANKSHDDTHAKIAMSFAELSGNTSKITKKSEQKDAPTITKQATK